MDDVPGCTCPAVEAQTFGEPAPRYVRGLDPTCPVHGPLITDRARRTGFGADSRAVISTERDQLAARIAVLERQRDAVLALCDAMAGPFSVELISADEVRAIYGEAK